MYIREYMTSPAISVTPDALLDDAMRIAHQHGIRRLPVVDNGKLIGLLTRERMRQASLSTSVTPLSTFGMRHQLLSMKVRDVMIIDVITVTPDTLLEEAVALAEQHQIGTLPVVDETGNLVGIVTNTDLIHLTSQLLGFGQKGMRLCIYGLGGYEDVRRCQILEILSKHRTAILSAFNVTLPATQQKCFVILLDTEDPSLVENDIKTLGLELELREIANQTDEDR